MKNPYEGAGQIVDYYKPESFTQKLKNSWDTERQIIAEDAEDNPFKHMLLPYGLHLPLALGAGYGAYKILDHRQRGINEKAFMKALQYETQGNKQLMKTYNMIKNSPRGISRDAWAAQQVAAGKISPTTLNELSLAGDRANRLIEIQNQMLNKKFGGVYQSVLKNMSPGELNLMSGMDKVTNLTAAERLGSINRRLSALKPGSPAFLEATREAKAAGDLVTRLNNAQRLGYNAPLVSSVFSGIGGIEGIENVKKLQRAGIVTNLGKPGFFQRFLRAFKK